MCSVRDITAALCILPLTVEQLHFQRGYQVCEISDSNGWSFVFAFIFNSIMYFTAFVFYVSPCSCTARRQTVMFLKSFMNTFELSC